MQQLEPSELVDAIMGLKPTYPARDRNDARSLLLLVVIFLLTLPLVNPYVRGDGNGYYAYVRSAVIDGDLQFDNEYRRADPVFRINLDCELSPTVTGHRPNQWGVGSSLLWTPFFLTAHMVVKGVNAVGLTIPADGYSRPYLWLCAIGTALYALFGLLLAFDIACRFASPLAAVASTLSIWFASSLPAYMYFLPFHVHALTSFTTACFLWYWFNTRSHRTARHWFFWGMVGGLVIDTYYVNGVFLVLALADWLRERMSAGRRRTTAEWLRHGLLFACGAAVALVPTFAVKWVIYGTPLTTGYGPGAFYWGNPQLAALGFSPNHGLFAWTPIAIPSVVGLTLLWRFDRWLSFSLLSLTAVFYYIIASYVNWFGHSSFGNRFFVALTPVFVIGLAAAIHSICGGTGSTGNGGVSEGKKRPAARGRWLVVASVLAILTLWNAGFLFQWGTNVIPNRGPVNFGTVGHNQVSVVPIRMMRFLVRYFSGRDTVVEEIEREDLAEMPFTDCDGTVQSVSPR